MYLILIKIVRLGNTFVTFVKKIAHFAHRSGSQGEQEAEFFGVVQLTFLLVRQAGLRREPALRAGAPAGSICAKKKEEASSSLPGRGYCA
jgi:hypothetical protein